jgi:hypothetical protein
MVNCFFSFPLMLDHYGLATNYRQTLVVSHICMSARLILLRKPDRMRLLDQPLLSHPVPDLLRLLSVSRL